MSRAPLPVRKKSHPVRTASSRVAPRRARDDDEVEDERQVRRALRRSDEDEKAPSGNRPDGLLVLKKSDKVHIRAELSDYTGKDMLSIREWVNTKNGWTRTAKGITISPEKGMIFCKSLLEAIQSLCGDV